MTELRYLENTYLFESTARIINFWENEFWTYIILDSTIFYPQWWGQQTDTGDILVWDNIFTIHMVKLNEKWVVFHYGTLNNPSALQTASFNIKGSIVNLQIDWENRIKNSKNHTAWHLIDIAIHNIWLELTATKGFHFQSGSYVQYTGIIENLNEGTIKQDLIASINFELKKLISQDLNIIVENWESDISNPDSPKWKSYRFVYFEWYKGVWCGCGWTHIKSTWELWAVQIKKIRVKKGAIKVSYITS